MTPAAVKRKAERGVRSRSTNHRAKLQNMINIRNAALDNSTAEVPQDSAATHEPFSASTSPGKVSDVLRRPNDRRFILKQDQVRYVEAAAEARNESADD